MLLREIMQIDIKVKLLIEDFLKKLLLIER